MSELSGSGIGDDDAGAPHPGAGAGAARPPRPRPPAGGGFQGGGFQGAGQQGGGRFAQDLHSVTIHAKQRTFYIDLKESTNGKFFKVSEKSRGGQKTTIMFDIEELDKFIAAFQEMKTKL